MNNFNINVNQNINQDRIWRIVNYVGIVVLLALLGIFPLYHYNSNLVEKNKELKNKIDEQKELKPIYLNLLNTLSNKDVLIWPNPEKKTISRGEAGKIQDDIRTIAGHSGLRMVSFTPDLSTMAGSSTSLLHNVVLKGEFSNFRKMLIGVGAVPYLDRIEEINILQNPDSMEFRMKIWTAIK